MQFKNCTPHAISIETAEVLLTLPPCGSVARLVGGPPPDETHVSIDGHTVRVSPPPSYEAVIGLPHDDGCAIIVSAMVGAQAPTLLGNNWKGRVFGPDTGKDAIRNDGHIVAVRGLVLYY